jgi:hypothetical protein
MQREQELASSMDRRFVKDAVPALYLEFMKEQGEELGAEDLRRRLKREAEGWHGQYDTDESGPFGSPTR